MKNDYETLELHGNASKEEIKKAYKRLASQYHPDRNVGNEEAATNKFKEITAAYTALTNPSSMQVNDLESRVGLPREVIEILDKQKLPFLKENYRRLQSVSKFFSAAMGISAAMFGSYLIYEQFNDTDYGTAWLFASFVVGYFGFNGKKDTNEAMKRTQRDIERLTQAIETRYGSL